MKSIFIALFLFVIVQQNAFACRPNRVYVVNKLIFNALNQIGKTYLDLEEIQSFKDQPHFDPALQCPDYYMADIQFKFSGGCIVDIGITTEEFPAKYIKKTNCDTK